MTLEVRAAVCHAPGTPLAIETVRLRPPGAGEVLIEIKASGICHSDEHQISGVNAPYPFPVIAGHEGAGIVVECGAGVSAVRPGDHVIPLSIPECGVCGPCRDERTNLCQEFFSDLGGSSGFSIDGQPVSAYATVGSFANYMVKRETAVARIRPDVPLDLACYLGCGISTGVGAVLHTARVEPGASVVVIGLGGIGLNVVQGAKLAGASRIIGVDINPARDTTSRRFGASDFIDGRLPSGEILSRIRELTSGGADHCFECVGSVALASLALEASHPGWGCATIIGLPPHDQPLSMAPFDLMLGRTLKGSFLGNVKTRSQLPGLLDLYVEGRLKLDELITHRLPLAAINEGFALMRRGQSIRSVVLF